MARPEKGFQFFRRRGIMGLPHKGTETRCRPRIYLTTGFQLIPARGRKPINEPVFASQAVISTYPRKGTETSAISLDGEWMPISTYPRKGTETCYGHCTRNRVRRFQLIPARGRKLNGDNLRRNLTKFQLIPARGRKHKEDDSGFYFAELFQLIPARGRKLELEVSFRLDLQQFQLIPARGQKTPHQKWCGVFLLRALTFRFPWAIPL